MGESIEDKAVVSRLADLFLDEQGRERLIIRSREYFGGKLKDAVNESLSSLVGQELQLQLDEDYTYIGFDEIYMRGPLVTRGLIGSGIVAAIVKSSGGVALLSVGGVAAPILVGGAIALLGFLNYREAFPNEGSFDSVNRLIPRNYGDEMSVDLHYRSESQSESSGKGPKAPLS